MEQMVKPGFRDYVPEPVQKTRHLVTGTFLLKLNNVYINEVLIFIMNYCSWLNLVCPCVVMYFDQSTYYCYKPM